MGTRNLTIVQSKGEYKVAQYCQWDGYPEGQGVTVLEFLRSLTKTKLSEFTKKVNACTFLADEKIEKLWESFGAKDGMVSMDNAEKFKKKYAHLDRDMGAKVLNYILKSKEGVELQNEINFIKDSLFCEWAYVIDLDEKTFEVYKGFNQNALKPNERFATFADGVKVEYSPCRLFLKYNFDELPTKEEFLKECETKEEEDN